MIHGLLLVALAIPSDPYVRSKVSPGGPGDHCLYWTESTTLVWRPNDQGNPETPGTTEVDAFRKSFAEWDGVMAACSSLRFSEGATTTSRNIGYLKTASEVANNQNVLLFRFKSCNDVAPLADSCWDSSTDDDDCGNKFDCWQHSGQAIALTTTTYDPQSGRILDFDIELNSSVNSMGGSFLHTAVDSPVCIAPNYATTCVAWDIENTVTHEIGHAMGLDHTLNPGSTMNPSAPPGETSKRSLDDGTKSYVCAAYPKGAIAKDCVIVPATGSLGPAAGGCGCTSGFSAAPLLLALAWLKRRRA